MRSEPAPLTRDQRRRRGFQMAEASAADEFVTSDLSDRSVRKPSPFFDAALCCAVVRSTLGCVALLHPTSCTTSTICSTCGLPTGHGFRVCRNADDLAAAPPVPCSRSSTRSRSCIGRTNSTMTLRAVAGGDSSRDDGGRSAPPCHHGKQSKECEV